MAVSGTNISMTSIWSEANTGSTPNDISVSDLFKKSYFEGPNGSFTIDYNAWGQYGNTSGDDKIYGLITENNENSWGDFSGLTYYYNNSTYLVGLQVNNSLPPPAGGYNNDYTVYVELWNSPYTYTYVATGAIPVAQGTVYGPSIISTTSTPIINAGYWRITFISDNLDPAITTLFADITINGNSTTQPLTASPVATDTFTGTEYVSYYAGFYNGIGLQFDILIRT
jgi:hypothetical protein